jgi:diguanylate cyclase (GGDEF)-like protein
MTLEQAAKTNAEEVFADDAAIADAAERIADDENVTPEELLIHYRFLTQKYRSIVRQLVKITHVGDVLQNKLMKTQQELDRRNDELELKNAELNRRNEELESARGQLEQANHSLHILSYLDGLTGVANRRHFDEYLEQEWRRAVRKGSTVALILLDIDHFKRLNDSAGHQFGDECLRRVADTLIVSVRRAGDLAARYGGEEFALILPDAQLDWALGFAEDIRGRVEALAIPHPESPLGVLTVSLGVAAEFPADPEAATTLIAKADRALYRAKQDGRNRVVHLGEAASPDHA